MTTLNLSDEDLADLLANFPHQGTLTDDQYDAWLIQSYLIRHMLDDELHNWS